MAIREEWIEPMIIINGCTTSVAESMTIRVALETFYSTLAEEGLGDDEHGKRMVNAYMNAIESIRSIMCVKK